MMHSAPSRFPIPNIRGYVLSLVSRCKIMSPPGRQMAFIFGIGIIFFCIPWMPWYYP